jgi:hypothetical protein
VRRIPRPSPALVVACLALLVSLGGTSVAAVNALAPNSVGTSQLKNNAVVTAKIKSGGVGVSDIASNAVQTAKIKNSAVTAAKLASNAVTNAKIGDNAVNSAKVEDGSLSASDLAAGTIPAPSDGFVRFLNGPIVVPSTLTTIANLSIPAAGSYVVIAKTYLTGTDTVTCRLEAGSDFDSSQATPTASTGPQTLTTIVGHTFAAAGSIDFRCSRDALATASANFVKIAAIKVGTVTNTG